MSKKLKIIIRMSFLKKKKKLDKSMEIILFNLVTSIAKKLQKMKLVGFFQMKKDSSDFEVKIIIMVRRLQKMIDLYSRCNKVSAFKQFEINLLKKNMRKINSINYLTVQKCNKIFLVMRFIYKKRIKESFRKINMYNL